MFVGDRADNVHQTRDAIVSVFLRSSVAEDIEVNRFVRLVRFD